MILFFSDQPSLLAPNIQMVFSALALAQCEVIWYFQHFGIASSKYKVSRVPNDIDAGDPTIGFLFDGMDKLCSLVHKYNAAIKGYALSYLSSSAGRIRFLLGTPGMVALDLDFTLKDLFQQIVHCLENVPKPQGESISAVMCDLSELRKHWLSVLMIVTSSRSSINIRHLEKATVSTGKEGLLSEGNSAYNWSRCIDELMSQLSKHGSLKYLYFYHHHLTAVFRNTMFGPEGRPHHCCAWLGIASSFPECASAIITEELNKIGRDAISYVESLIESIMGGLEGLINILDSEGGFGALEMQLNPEQAALRMNAIKVSSHSAKSPKGFLGLQLPGHESRPESINSVKMLEAAMQRLTSLCSVLNDMEPVCVLNHVFVLREYMRDCILGNFRRRLLTVLRTDSSLQRPSIVESLLCRHIRIIHIVEQHLSMDLSEGVRQVLLSETFSASILDPHTSLQSGSAIEMISSWYMDIIVKDSNSAGVTFAPSRSCFKSLKLVGEYSADAYTDAKELKSLIRMFGGYGFDRLDRLAREHVAALLSCIDTGLQENREALEAMAGSLSSGDPVKREENLRHVLDLETLVGFCIQAGQAIAFWRLLADATGAVLEEHAPLIFSLFSGASKHLPDNEIPEKDEISRLRKVASSIGAGNDVDWIHSIMKECGAACDSSWSLLPYLCASFMASNMWGAAIFDACTGGFSNNMHCLARCINAVIGGSELVRMERKEQQWRSESRSGGHPHEYLETDLRRSLAEASIKSAVQVFVKCSVTIILEPWNQTPSSSRSHLAPKLIFLDQLCCLSPYLPRSTLEAHVPYAILRSAYSERYGSSRPALPPLELPLRHLRQSPLILLNRGDSTLVSATAQGEVNTGRSGPLDYGSNRKARFGSSTGADQGSSPLAMFMASRSGPLRYK